MDALKLLRLTVGVVLIENGILENRNPLKTHTTPLAFILKAEALNW